MELIAILAQMEDLLGDQTMTRDEVQQHIFELTRKTGRKDVKNWDPEVYKYKWLPSPVFFLVNVPTDRVNAARPPHNPQIVERKIEQRDPEPVIIDRNVPSRYWTAKKPTAWRGDTLVMDGAHRTAAAQARGDAYLPAWVGSQALPYILSDKPPKVYDWRDNV